MSSSARVLSPETSLGIGSSSGSPRERISLQLVQWAANSSPAGNCNVHVNIMGTLRLGDLLQGRSLRSHVHMHAHSSRHGRQRTSRSRSPPPPAADDLGKRTKAPPSAAAVLDCDACAAAGSVEFAPARVAGPVSLQPQTLAAASEALELSIELPPAAAAGAFGSTGFRMRRRRSSAGSDDSASANTASGPPSLSTPSHSSCEDLEAQGACVTVGDVVASLLKSKAVLRIADEIWEAMHANGQPKTPSAWNSSLRLQPPGPGSTISIASTGPEDDLLDYDRYMRMHFAIQRALMPSLYGPDAAIRAKRDWECDRQGERGVARSRFRDSILHIAATRGLSCVSPPGQCSPKDVPLVIQRSVAFFYAFCNAITTIDARTGAKRLCTSSEVPPDFWQLFSDSAQVARLPDPPAEALEDGPDREGRPAPRPTTPLELPSRLEPGRDRDRDREAGEPRLPRATAAALRRTGADLAWLAVQNRLARRLRSFGAVGSSPSFEFATFYC